MQIITAETMKTWNPYTYGELSRDPFISPENAAIDAELTMQRINAMSAIAGPRVGDFVQFPNEDTPRRFTHDWQDGTMQTTVAPKGHPCSGDMSFHIFKNGVCSFSGSLDPSIPLDQCVDTGEVKDGRVWFFSRDWSGAHRGVSALIPFRVYRYTPVGY